MAANGNTTRDKIQRCALRLFSEKGYNNVTIDDICSDLEITRGAFYYHYSSKDSLFDILYNTPFAFDMDTMAKVFGAENCWGKYWLLHEHGFMWLEETGAELVSTIITLALEKKNKRFFPALNSPYDEITAGIIEMGQKAGHFGVIGEPLRISRLARNIYVGVIQDWCCDNGSFDLIAAVKRGLALGLQVREDISELSDT
jgi:hypothetical protein